MAGAEVRPDEEAVRAPLPHRRVAVVAARPQNQVRSRGLRVKASSPHPPQRLARKEGASAEEAAAESADLQGATTAPPPPIVLPNAPVVAPTSRWTPSELVLSGTLAGKPNETYQVQLYISREADRHQGEEKGWGEGEKYIGTASAKADGSGRSSFSLMLKVPDIFGDGRTTGYITATATDAVGSTSRFSRSLELRQGQ